MAGSVEVTCHFSPLWQCRSAAQGYELSLNRTKELVHEEVEHPPPLENLAELRTIEQEILLAVETSCAEGLREQAPDELMAILDVLKKPVG